MSCDRAWAYRYIAKIREPEFAWNDRKAPPRLRSKAVGKATHGVFEAWQTPGAVVKWRDLPGQIALSGAHHVPHPERVHTGRVEAPIGSVPLPPRDGANDGPSVAYELHGVLWAGYRDLLVSAPGEFIRLKIDAPDGWVLYDYKTTASIEQYALSPAELARDPQACLYVAATCDELGLEELPVRWLYLESKKVRKSLPVDACIRSQDAKERIHEYAVKARRLDAIERVEDAAMNTGACGEYGGCYYHVSNGGPCNARRSIGGLIQARVPRKKDTMALSSEATKAFNGFKKGAAPAAEPDTTQGDAHTDAPPGPDAPAEAVPSAVVGMTGTPKRGRPAKSASKATGTAATIAELSAALVEAQAAADVANSRIADLLTAIREACG